MCVDIAGDRLPISGGNEIIIIQKQKPLTARAVCADVARGARAEPTFGFYEPRRPMSQSSHMWRAQNLCHR